MDWSPILVALVIAVVITAVLVLVLGWRRPGAPQTESDVVSAVFVFVILLLATWAAGVWLVPWGPVAWGVSWVGWLAVALVVALVLAATSQRDDRRRQRNAEPSPATDGEMAAVGFGVAYWILLVMLLIAGLTGSLRT